MTTYAWPDGRIYTPRSMEWGRLDNDRATTSSLNGYTQTLSVPGMRWQVIMNFGEQYQAERRKLAAFLFKLDGMAHRVQLYDMGIGKRDGNPAGTIALSSVQVASSMAQFATSVSLKGCGAGKTLLAEDKIGIGGQVFMNTDDTTADGSGNMTVTVRPMARAAASTNDAVTTSKAIALFVLADPLSVPRDAGGICPPFSVRFVEVFA